VFGSVVAGAFQIAFRAEIHANDFFYFLKIIFNISTSKRSKKYKPHSILVKKKNLKFGETQLQTQCQTVSHGMKKNEGDFCHLNLRWTIESNVRKRTAIGVVSRTHFLLARWCPGHEMEHKLNSKANAGRSIFYEEGPWK